MEGKEIKKEIVSLEDSMVLANTLMEEFGEQMRIAALSPVDQEARFGSEKAIANFLRQVPEEVRERYDAHGITKNSGLEKLAALLNICANKMSAGNSGPLSGGAYSAYTHGVALIVSRPDNLLFVKGGKRSFSGDKAIAQVDIGFIILSPMYYPLQEKLKELFSDIEFIRANQIKEYVV